MELHVYYSERFKEHDIGDFHPESPKRLIPIIEAIKQYNEMWSSIKILEPRAASERDLLLVHDHSLINLVKEISMSGGGRLNFDTVITEKTFEIAKLAVGASIQAAVDTFINTDVNAFAIVRPPGHHADMTTAGGFCFFNNIAIAAEYLIREKGVKKVAIIDLDNHYGNGTAQIFYHRNDVLYISLHSHPQYSYPGSGYPSEIGLDKGKGFTINFPLLPGSNTIDWLFALNYATSFIEEYGPEFILVSIGFDGLRDDPVGYLALDPIAFQGAGYILSNISKNCNNNLTFVLEGGYLINKLNLCTKRLLKGIFGQKPKILDDLSNKVSGYTLAIINQVKKAQKNYWTIK